MFGEESNGGAEFWRGGKGGGEEKKEERHTHYLSSHEERWDTSRLVVGGVRCMEGEWWWFRWG